jgi:hypothetical protein
VYQFTVLIMLLHLYEGCSNETHLGIVLGKGVEADKK